MVSSACKTKSTGEFYRSQVWGFAVSSVELLLNVLTFPLRKLNFGRSKILHKIMHNEILFRRSLKTIINVSASCLVFSDFFSTERLQNEIWSETLWNSFCFIKDNILLCRIKENVESWVFSLCGKSALLRSIQPAVQCFTGATAIPWFLIAGWLVG